MKSTLRIVSLLLVILLLPAQVALGETYYITYRSVTGQEPTETGYAKDGGYYQVFEGVDQEDLDVYLTTLNAFNFVPFLLSEEENKVVYGSLPIEDGKGLYVLYRPDDDVLAIRGEVDAHVIDQYETVQTLLNEIWSRSLAMPDDVMGYVLPQFYAVSKTSQDEFVGQQIEGVSDFFDNARCWMEIYPDIPYEIIDQYLSLMYLFGCGFEGKRILVDDEGSYTFIVDLKQDDQALVTLVYYPTTQIACVVYNPKVSFDLKDGSDLIDIIG